MSRRLFPQVPAHDFFGQVTNNWCINAIGSPDVETIGTDLAIICGCHPFRIGSRTVDISSNLLCSRPELALYSSYSIEIFISYFIIGW
jgi:hypothetical protein